MPDFVRVIGVRCSDRRVWDAQVPPFPEVGEDDHTVGTLVEALKVAAERVPALDVDVLYEGSSEWFEVGHVGLRAGALVREGVTLSREAERAVTPDFEFAPDDVIELDTLADSFLDELTAAALHGDPDADENALTLPFAFRDLAPTLDALAKVARHVEMTSTVIVVIDDVPYVARLSVEDGASLEPLFVWTDEPELRAWIRSLLPPPGKVATQRLVTAKRRHVPVDRARPLVTGSAAHRLRTISDLAHPEIVREAGGMRITSWSDTAVPGAYERFVEAVQAPENRGPDFDEVRQALYAAIAGAAPSADAAAAVLEGALHVDSEALRAELYDLLSNLDAEVAHRALVFGFKHDSDMPQRRIRSVIWRSTPAVEMLVSDELVPAWIAEGPGSQFARRVLKLIQNEHLHVQDEWLAAAPDDLRAAVATVNALGMGNEAASG